ncbi:MAG: hypothetical protein IT340_15355 [Chloroflexi bacterium]|nr:hypothetical protein [Chloroflexota bacterium]
MAPRLPRWLQLGVVVLLLVGCGAPATVDQAITAPAAETPRSVATTAAPAPHPSSHTTGAGVATVMPDQTDAGVGSTPVRSGRLRVEPGTTVNLGWAAETVTLSLLADGGDVAWTAVPTAGADWLAVERAAGMARVGVADTVVVRIDRDRLRRQARADATGQFQGGLMIRAPGGDVSVTVLGREAGQPLRQCTPGGTLVLEPSPGPAVLTVRETAGRCIDWYLVAAPTWLSLEAEQTDVRGGGQHVRALIVDAERRLRPFTTTAGATSAVGLVVDWRRVPARATGAITVIEASRDLPTTLTVVADPLARTVQIEPPAGVPTTS